MIQQPALRPPVQRSPELRATSSEPLYEPLDEVFIRAPAFPIEAYQQLASGIEAPLFNAQHPRVRLVLATGSLSLLDALERTPTSQKEEAHRATKQLRYLIRMATRPTPFGLFAGVALSAWGDTTTLSLAKPPYTHTRPDMRWLMRFVWALEELPEVRRCLRFVLNTAAYVRGDRVYVQRKAIHDQLEAPSSTSVRATPVVKRALALARRPIAYTDLVKALLAASPKARRTQVEGLLTELWRQTILFTDLRPPLTAISPARYVWERLSTIPAAGPVYDNLTTVLTAIERWDEKVSEQDVIAYRELIRLMKSGDALLSSYPLSQERDAGNSSNPLASTDTQPKFPSGQQPDALIQIDMAHPLGGDTLSLEIGKEAAKVAELLLRISSRPHGFYFLKSYREQFIERYGENRFVPLLEATDPNFGVGLPRAYLHAQPAPRPDTPEQQLRDQTLLELALRAWQRQERIVELDEELIKRLETVPLAPEDAPLSQDIGVLVAASSAAAVDAGQFHLVLGPNTGSTAARRTLGRFAHLLGDRAYKALSEMVRLHTQGAPDRLWAELVYLPRDSRLANVAIRPVTYPYEIVWGASAGVDDQHVIPIDELQIGISRGRLTLRWIKTSTEVSIVNSHMLNPQVAAPPLLRFLLDIAHDAVPEITSFSWGPAEEFPFLPRVQAGRAILRLAQWTLSSPLAQKDIRTDSPDVFRESMEGWRQRWNVPRYVYLAEMDNRLLLDLDSRGHLELLRSELRTLKPGGQVLLQEGFPGPDESWVEGPGGHYLTEVVVSLIRSQHASSKAQAEMKNPTLVSSAVGSLDTDLRLRPLGSDWIFMKLYIGSDLHERLLAGPIQAMVESVLSQHLADDWFFIRFADPDPHIRLRLRGNPEALTERLLPSLCEWGKSLVSDGLCLKVVFDTYEREVERYGGLAGIALAETLFGADSLAVIQLLTLLHQHAMDLDRQVLAALTVDDLLVSLGLSLPERTEWYRQRVTARHQAGKAYREKSTQLRSLVGDSSRALAALTGGKQVAAILAERHRSIELVARQLADLASSQILSQSLAFLYGSFVHMHCNRLLGVDRATEDLVLGLLLRTSESLERAPLQ